jgi:hypothetical protein
MSFVIFDNKKWSDILKHYPKPCDDIKEEIWEKILKNKYMEDISCQYKYKNSIFDFIHIKNNILYEVLFIIIHE